MKTRLFYFLGLLAVTLSIHAQVLEGDRYEFQYQYPAGTGAKLTYSPLSDNTVEVVFHANYLNLKDVEIPEKVTDPNDRKVYTVTSIGEIAFENCQNMKSIKIPNTIRVIKKYAFANNSADEINISENVETIEDYAFEKSPIKSLKLPAKVTRLERYAFSNCDLLESVHIANPAIFIGPHCFEGSKMKSVTFGENAPEFQDKEGCISEYAFAYCENLQKIEIPDNMPAIGSYAFAYCADQSVLDFMFDTDKFNQGNKVYSNFMRKMVGKGLEHLTIGKGGKKSVIMHSIAADC